MISRRTASLLGAYYTDVFAIGEVNTHNLYDFLFDRDYSPWFCNAVKALHYPRSLKEFIMKLHTGETTIPSTRGWTWQDREQLGQTYLEKLVADICSYDVIMNGLTYNYDIYRRSRGDLVKQVQLDGYKFLDGRLIPYTGPMKLDHDFRSNVV